MTDQNIIKEIAVKPSETIVSKSNVRSSDKLIDIPELACDIKHRSLLQSVVARYENGVLAVLCGRRRRAACLLLEKEYPDFLMNVVVVEVDDSEGIAISLSENKQREDMSDLSQYKAFSSLIKQKWSPERISEEYKISLLDVHKILSIGNLPKVVLDEAETGSLSEGGLKVLAIAKPSLVTKWTKAFKQGTAPNYPSDIKNLLYGENQPILVDKALFDVKASNLATSKDFFNDVEFFLDNDAFWLLQNKEIESQLETFKSNGWELREFVDYFAQYEYEKRSKNNGGCVFYRIDRDGGFVVHKGFALISDLEKEAKGFANSEAQVKPKKNEITEKMRNYLGSYKLLAARAQLTDDYDLTQRSLLLMMLYSCGTMGHGDNNTLYSTNEDVAQGQLIETPTYKLLKKRFIKVYQLCGFDKDTFSSWSTDYNVVEKKVLSMSIENVQKAITALTIDRMTVHDRLTDTVLEHSKPDMSLYWDAEKDSAFFDLVSGKQVLLNLLRSVSDDETVSSQEKNKVTVIREFTKQTATKISSWLPVYFKGELYRDNDSTKGKS